MPQSEPVAEGAAEEIAVDRILRDQAECRHARCDLRGRHAAPAEIEGGAEQIGSGFASGVQHPISLRVVIAFVRRDARLRARRDAALRFARPILVINTLLSRIRGRRYGV